jgi:hypothetical protein
MDKWLKDILPDKDPYHNRGRDQMRKKGGSEIRVPVLSTCISFPQAGCVKKMGGRGIYTPFLIILMMSGK